MGKVERELWGASWSCAGQKSPSFQLAREQAHQGERMVLCLGLFTGFWDSKDQFSSWAESVISAICSCLGPCEGPCHCLELLQGALMQMLHNAHYRPEAENSQHCRAMNLCSLHLTGWPLTCPVPPGPDRDTFMEHMNCCFLMKMLFIFAIMENCIETHSAWCGASK